MTFTKPCVVSEIQELIYLHPLQLVTSLELYIQQQYHESNENEINNNNSPNSSPSYDEISCKYLLKIYQCYPDLINIEIIQQILILSLSAPSSSASPSSTSSSSSSSLVSSSLLSLIPMKIIQQNFILKQILSFISFLETGRFLDFWNEFNQERNLFRTNLSLVNSMRNFICQNLFLVYQNIEMKLLGSYLGLNENQLTEYLAHSSDRFEVPQPCSLLLPLLTSPQLSFRSMVHPLDF